MDVESALRIVQIDRIYEKVKESDYGVTPPSPSIADGYERPPLNTSGSTPQPLIRIGSQLEREVLPVSKYRLL